MRRAARHPRSRGLSVLTAGIALGLMLLIGLAVVLRIVQLFGGR